MDSDFPHDEESPIFDELLDVNEPDAWAARQLATEEILGRLIAVSLDDAAETVEEGTGTTPSKLLVVILDAYLDTIEGQMYGTAYTNVFDRVRVFVNRYHAEPPQEAV